MPHADITVLPASRKPIAIVDVTPTSKRNNIVTPPELTREPGGETPRRMMSRKPINITSKQIQTARGDWYTYHFANRQLFKALPEAVQHAYQTLNATLTPPSMTIFGGVVHDWPPRATFEAAAKHGMKIELMNVWYLSDEGWKAFQELWQALPEPVGELYTAPCVQERELYPLSTVEEMQPARASE